MNINTNSLPFINSKLFWYLFLCESKSYFITSSTLSLIVVSMSSLTECIAIYGRNKVLLIEFSTCQIFEIMMYLKYCLILLSLSNFITFFINYFHIQYNYYSNITYFYWCIAKFVFLMIKKILNISRYSIVNCFSFFF